jgi:hypothetical protein
MGHLLSRLRGSLTGRRGALRGGLWIAALCAAVAAVAIAVGPASGASSSTPKTALLDGSSITTSDGIEKEGVPISLEQYAAEQAGYTVTVVSGTEWEAMTAEEFAHYQLLIVGDPFCSDTASSAITTASTWAPVVMGTSGLNPLVGNRVVVGTDPEFHYLEGAGGAQPTNAAEPTTGGAEHLEQDGITYAGGVSGATGVYFGTSCEDPNPTPEGSTPVAGGDLTVLEQLTTSGSGQWTENTEVPCGGSVQQIAENPTFDSGATKLTDENIQGWGCSDHITFPHFPTDWNALAVATDTSEKPTCGTDPESKEEVCGEAYVLVAGEGIVAAAPNLELSPAAGTEGAGGTHTVTAKVIRDGEPVADTAVNFLITGQNAGVTGTCTTSTGESDPTCETDATGVVRYTYSDTNGVGTDTINASIVLAGTTEHATASEEWVSGAPTETTPTETTPTETTPTETTPTTTTTTTATTTTTTTTAKTASSETLAFKSSEVNKACASKRDITIHIQNAKRLGLVSAVVEIDGKDKKTLTRGHLRTAINLVGLPKGTFTVEIVARRHDGRIVKGDRVYHTCESKQPGHTYLPL